ncbi:hypothetical protein EV424DRAFT_1545924 [Suillus variegatus]|nr:hypothetical protein EV424DRAFT_1545924 [Suillus variegatus]
MYTRDQEVQQTLLYMYADLAGNSILIYDHMVTLQEEITFIWRRPKALSAILFLLNRYVALLSNICGLIKDFVPVSDERFIVLRFLNVYRLLNKDLAVRNMRYTDNWPFSSKQRSFVVNIMVIRTYALYGCSKRLLAWMVIVTIALTGIACAGTFGQFSGDIEVVPGLGCNETFSKSMYVVLIPVLCTRSKVVAELVVRIGLAYVALSVFDLIIFILTVRRICKAKNLLRLSLVSRNNIIDIIFCDGMMFFGAITLSNILNILTYYIGSVNLRGSLFTFTGCLSVTLISRLMLNLHQTIDTGVLSTPVQDEGPGLPVLTTRISVESVVSSHY